MSTTCTRHTDDDAQHAMPITPYPSQRECIIIVAKRVAQSFAKELAGSTFLVTSDARDLSVIVAYWHVYTSRFRDLNAAVGITPRGEANRKQAADHETLSQTVKELEATVERLMVLIEQGH
uniref:Uncharacterized protein n=1 Tax=Sphaerodactylus townsendi TaxID=933632 RepID=A0ACB8EHQ7_9SAUR